MPLRQISPLANTTAKSENEGSQLKYSREYKINAVTVPAEKINDLGKFFHQINQDERNMAVLKKGN